MTKKKTEAVETIDPLYGLLKNWWARAIISAVIGLVFTMLCQMTYGTFPALIFGVGAILLTLVAPFLFVKKALEEENGGHSTPNRFL